MPSSTEHSRWSSWPAYLTAVVFLASIAAKVVEPQPFVESIQHLGNAIGGMFNGAPRHQSLFLVLALLVLAAECVLAIGLLLMPRARGLRRTAIGLLLLFSVVLVYYTINPPAQGCGCATLAEPAMSPRVEAGVGIVRNCGLLLVMLAFRVDKGPRG